MTGQARAGRPRSTRADAAILDAAAELFAEHGIEGASIEQIARRAGVTRATVYRRWTRKEDLVAQALGRVKEGADPGIEDWAAVGADDFLRLLSEVTPGVLARPDLGRLLGHMLGSAHSHPELLQAYWDSYLAPRRAAFTQSLEAMRAAGRLDNDADPEVLQDIVAGALIYRFLVRPGPHTDADRRDYGRKLLAAIGLKEA